LVGDHDLDGQSIEAGQRERAVRRRDHVVRLVVQRALEGRKDLRLVVDAKHGGAPTLAHSHASFPDRSSGRRTTNSVPSPRDEWTSIRPPWARMILYATWSPSPVPFPTGFVVKKGSKMRVRFSRGMPQPLSRTDATAHPSSSRVVTTIRPFSAIACAAFTIRLTNTWTSRWGYAFTCGRVP